MAHTSVMVDLGFIYEKLPAGTHICQVYSSDKERDESLLAFLLKGLQTGERNACFSENITRERLQNHFAQNGLDYDRLVERGSFSLAPTRDVYFHEDKFNPERMLEVLTTFHEESIRNGYSGARLIGEMSPEISRITGGERLLEYECRVTMLLENHPVTTICQYDAREFDGATIMDILKVHPMMIVDGGVIHNPFFVPPDEFLRRIA